LVAKGENSEEEDGGETLSAETGFEEGIEAVIEEVDDDFP